MIKPEEIRFIAFVLAHGGRIPSDLWKGIKKQEYRYLSKWTGKGWWEFGVSLRSGWLTPEGKEALEKRFREQSEKDTDK